MKRQPKYSPEVIEAAVRTATESDSEYPSQSAAITLIATKISWTAKMLRRWMR
jgi:transposase